MHQFDRKKVHIVGARVCREEMVTEMNNMDRRLYE